MIEEEEVREVVNKALEIMERHHYIYAKLFKEMERLTKMGCGTDLTEVQNRMNYEFHQVSILFKFIVDMERYCKAKIFHHKSLMDLGKEGEEDRVCSCDETH
jgi:hypothetical protein